MSCFVTDRFLRPLVSPGGKATWRGSGKPVSTPMRKERKKRRRRKRRRRRRRKKRSKQLLEETVEGPSGEEKEAKDEGEGKGNSIYFTYSILIT